MSNEPITVTYSLEEVLIRSEERLSGEIKTLDEKVEGIAKRLDYQEFLNRGVLVGLILAVLAGLAKYLGFIGNP